MSSYIFGRAPLCICSYERIRVSIDLCIYVDMYIDIYVHLWIIYTWIIFIYICERIRVSIDIYARALVSSHICLFMANCVCSIVVHVYTQCHVCRLSTLYFCHIRTRTPRIYRYSLPSFFRYLRWVSTVF